MASQALEDKVSEIIFDEFRFSDKISDEGMKRICDNLASKIVDLVEQKTLNNICSCGFCG